MPLAPSLPATGESVKPTPPKEEVEGVTTPTVEEPIREERTEAVSPPAETKLQVEMQPGEEKKMAVLPVPSSPAPSQEGISAEAKPAEEKQIAALPVPSSSVPSQEGISAEAKPAEEKQIAVLPVPSSSVPSQEGISAEAKPAEEKQIAALAAAPATSAGKEKPKKEVLREPGEAKLVDKSQPIDITSDRVETYSKENLIIFQGNVTARQKDIVIYADSLEALVIEGGKGIEKVIAGGNVKIQQGLRVANCQKAVFYNIGSKIYFNG